MKYEPNPETDWPALIHECLLRRRYRLEKWKAAGGGIGISESEIFLPAGEDLPEGYE